MARKALCRQQQGGAEIARVSRWTDKYCLSSTGMRGALMSWVSSEASRVRSGGGVQTSKRHSLKSTALPSAPWRLIAKWGG